MRGQFIIFEKVGFNLQFSEIYCSQFENFGKCEDQNTNFEKFIRMKKF